jgi:hypothetical protein
MRDKDEMLTKLREEFLAWEALLTALSDEEADEPLLPSELSVKDNLAHLRAWQQRSIARLEAALEQREPVMPEWPFGPDPEAPEVLDQTNAWIFESNRGRAWAEVRREWRDGFARFLELAEAVPAKEYAGEGRYEWLEGYALLAVLEGSFEHHDEHLAQVLAWQAH